MGWNNEKFSFLRIHDFVGLLKYLLGLCMISCMWFYCLSLNSQNSYLNRISEKWLSGSRTNQSHLHDFLREKLDSLSIQFNFQNTLRNQLIPNIRVLRHWHISWIHPVLSFTFTQLKQYSKTIFLAIFIMNTLPLWNQTKLLWQTI